MIATTGNSAADATISMVSNADTHEGSIIPIFRF